METKENEQAQPTLGDHLNVVAQACSAFNGTLAQHQQIQASLHALKEGLPLAARKVPEEAE